MIQSGCTTGCEGIMSNKIVINYTPIKYYGNGEFLKKVSLNIEKENKVIQFIKNIENITFKKNKYQKILNIRIQFKNNKLATKNILSIWVNLSKKIIKKNNNNYLIYLHLLIYENIKSLYQMLILLLQESMGELKN